MMKKLFLVLLLAIVPLTASAAQDSEMLLTPDGTLYTIDRMWASEYALATGSSSFLVLSQRRGDQLLRYIVPATLTAGVHTDAALAYDAASKTVFVFWQHTYTIFSSQLVFSAFRNDATWSDATTFGNPAADNRNLRIAVTHKVQVDDRGSRSIQPEINVHAAWWEYNSTNRRQAARYALLTIENGEVIAHTAPRDLAEFLMPTSSASATTTRDEDEQSLLKTPALFATPDQDAIDVVFGDLKTDTMSRVRIRPTKPSADARIRIPVGVREQNVGKPRFKSGSESAERITAINGEPDRLAFYQQDGQVIRYVMYKNEQWTAAQTIALDEQVSDDAAVAAIRRLLNEQ